MMNRIILITLLLMALVLTGCQIVVPPSSVPPTSVAPAEETTFIEKTTGAEVSVPFEAIQIILEYDPGARSPLHTHGGPGLVTVISGEWSVQLEETGEELVFGPGESFYEEVGAVFSAGNGSQEQTRLAVLFLLPEGVELTTPHGEADASDEMPPGPTVLSRTSMPVTAAAE